MSQKKYLLHTFGYFSLYGPKKSPQTPSIEYEKGTVNKLLQHGQKFIPSGFGNWNIFKAIFVKCFSLKMVCAGNLNHS